MKARYILFLSLTFAGHSLLSQTRPPTSGTIYFVDGSSKPFLNILTLTPTKTTGFDFTEPYTYFPVEYENSYRKIPFDKVALIEFYPTGSIDTKYFLTTRTGI
jgi:hypothetical protein